MTVTPGSDAQRVLGQIERGEIRTGAAAAREIAARHQAAYGNAVQRAAIAKTDDPVFYEGEAGWLVNVIEPETTPAVPLPPADQAAELEKLVRWHREDGKALDEMRATIQRLRAERDELRRMADGTADTQPRVVDRPTLAAALDDLHTLIATSSRDWQTYRVDAWLWAVLCGWDCEQAEHDDTCTHGALEETAAMHGWDDATVAKARRYRAAVRALTAIADAAQQGDETAGTETEAHAPFCQWRVETLDGDEWMPASGLRRDRAQAAAQFRMASERRPLWSDGTPVRRRLVRETTTYTVEQPAVEARKDGAER